VKSFFPRWLARSIRGSLGSGLIAMASLALSGSLVFMLVAVSSGVERQLGAELKAYGANLLALPRLAPMRFGLGAFELGPVEDERFLETGPLAGLPPDLAEGVVPGLLLRVVVEGGEVGAVGYDLPRLHALNPLWRVSGRWPASPGELLVGTTLAARLGLTPGGSLRLRVGDRELQAAVAGLVETGGGEDESLLLSLGEAQQIGRAHV
jgi:putative ABC transport system permease protein